MPQSPGGEILFSPIFNLLAAIFIPMPVLYYRVLLGRRIGGMVLAGAAIVLIALCGGFTQSAVFFMKFLVLGFVLGELFEKKLSVEKTVSYACGSILGLAAVGCFIYTSAAGIELTQLISGIMKPLVDIFVDNLKNTGIVEENRIAVIEKQLLLILVWSAPALFASSVLFETWLCLMAAKPFMLAKKVFYPDFGDLRKWQAPEWLIWVAIGSAASILLADGFLVLLGLSGIIILYTVYFFQGMAIISHFLDKREISRGWKIVIYGLIIFYPIAPLITSVFGFFDIWANFRKMETVVVSDEE